jgi:hypothetical protein
MDLLSTEFEHRDLRAASLQARAFSFSFMAVTQAVLD